MKRIVFGLVLLSSTLYLTSCKEKEKTAASAKITDMPVTSKSEEAKKAFQEGLMYLDQADNKKSKAAFMKATSLDPDMGIAWIYLANTAQSTEEFMSTLQKAKDLMQGTSDWEKLYYELENSFLSNDWEKRMDAAKKIAEKYPDAARAQVEIGAAYEAGNQVDKARESYKNAINLDPKWVGGYSVLMNSYLFISPKDFKEAEVNAVKAAELAPNSPGIQIALGDCYRAQNDLEKARTSYTKAIELDPADPVGYYKKGHVNSFLGNYDEARNDYMEGAKHDDNDQGPKQWIAYTYLYGGDHEAAMKQLMENAGSAKNANQKMGFLNSCALACVQAGKADHLNDVIEMMKTPSEEIGNATGTAEAKAQQKANLLNWAALSNAIAGKFDDAKGKAEEYKATIEPIKNPTKMENYEYLLGFICMKEKKYADAVAHFQKANMNSVFDRYWLGLAYEANGDKDKANEIFKEVAVYNFNGADFAVVRNEAKKKAGG